MNATDESIGGGPPPVTENMNALDSCLKVADRIALDLTMLEKTVIAFKCNPFEAPNLHSVALKKYDLFCRRRTADLYTTFLTLIGDEDLTWCEDARYLSSFNAMAPMAGKQNLRPVSGGANISKQMHGIVRYEYHGCAIEECRKNGRQHGLRVVCTLMGDIWIRLYKGGRRLAQIVLHGDLSIQSSIDNGGLKKLRKHLDLIRVCFGRQSIPGLPAAFQFYGIPKVSE